MGLTDDDTEDHGFVMALSDLEAEVVRKRREDADAATAASSSTVKSTFAPRQRGGKTSHLGFHPGDRALRTSCVPDDPSGCKNVTRQGTNAYYDITTCKTCGWRNKVEKETPVPKCKPADCPHINYDHRGSTKDTKKYWCKDCCTFVSEIPKTEFLAREQIGKTVSNADRKILEPVKRLTDLGTRRITAEQAVEIGELFNRHVRRTAEALQDLHEARRSTTAAQMISALEDTIERTLLSADEIPVDVNSR